MCWILAEDRAGAFRFAPLDSDAFRDAVPEALRANLPDNLVVFTANRVVLTRAAGCGTGSPVPTVILDRPYDGLAHVRCRLFAKPAGVCPLLLPTLRACFDLDGHFESAHQETVVARRRRSCKDDARPHHRSPRAGSLRNRRGYPAKERADLLDR